LLNIELINSPSKNQIQFLWAGHWFLYDRSLRRTLIHWEVDWTFNSQRKLTDDCLHV